MEALSCLPRRPGEEGCLSGFKARRGGKRVEVSHLLFVDDAIMFCKTFQVQMII